MRIGVRDLEKRFGEHRVLRGVSLEVRSGELLALLGPSGCGKTTLLRCLLGELAPDAGRVVLGQGLEIGYFDQHLSGLDDDAEVVDAVRPPRQQLEAQQRRSLLARFGISGDTALQKVASLSGGERCRAALARLAAMEANFLVLDEPTNHLDLWARDSLEQALNAFDGTVLLVSHDRYFINRVADHLLVAGPGGFRVIEGDYDTYQNLLRSGQDAAAAAPADRAERPETAKRDKPRPGDAARATSRKRRFPYRKVKDLEAEIHEREARLEHLHAMLALPETHRDGHKARQVKAEIAEVQQAVETLYAHWEEAVELNW